MNLIVLMMFFKVFKIKRAVDLKERFGKARSPAPRLGGSYCGICSEKDVTLIVFYSEGFNLTLSVIIPP